MMRVVPRTAGLDGAGLICMTILLGWVLIQGGDAIDIRLATPLLLNAERERQAVSLAQAVSALGAGWPRWAMLAALAAWIWRRCGARVAIGYVAGVLAGLLGNSALKLLFDRQRPDLIPWLDTPMLASFPSGHSANTMTLLLLAALLLRSRAGVVLAVALTIAIGMTRVMLGVHWPSDVLGGWLFGAGAALVAWAVIQRGQPGPGVALKR